MASLLNIVESLQNPNVRLADNFEYKLDVATLGMLYAHTVSKAGSSRSPARAQYRDESVSSEYENILKKKFQGHTRSMLREELANLKLRNNTAEMLVDRFSADEFDSSLYAEGSLEYHVVQLAEVGEFQKIGELLVKGVISCDYKARKIGKNTNFPHLKEYETLADIFAKSKEY